MGIQVPFEGDGCVLSLLFSVVLFGSWLLASTISGFKMRLLVSIYLLSCSWVLTESLYCRK